MDKATGAVAVAVAVAAIGTAVAAVVVVAVAAAALQDPAAAVVIAETGPIAVEGRKHMVRCKWWGRFERRPEGGYFG